MPYYRTKSVNVFAIRWNGNSFSLQAPQWLTDALLSGTVKIGDTAGNSNTLLVTNETGRSYVHPGGYLVNNGGVLETWESVPFERVFEEVS